MESAELAALFTQAVAASRVAETPDDYERIQQTLERAKWNPDEAVSLAIDELATRDSIVRGVACDLIGLISQVDVSVRAEAVPALLCLTVTEADNDVRRSLVQALGFTNDVRAVPFMVEMARHHDRDTRYQVAVSLPSVMVDDDIDSGIAALIELSTDIDDEVRNWATFGYGQQSNADGHALREQLFERTKDSYAAVREEGILGLARRRDPRALALVADLLGQEEASMIIFQAAALLADPSLLPLLEEFDPEDPDVAGALLECDPEQRSARESAAFALFDEIHHYLPDWNLALYCQRFDLGLELLLTVYPPGQTDSGSAYSVHDLLRRAEGDPALAARLVESDGARPK